MDMKWLSLYSFSKAQNVPSEAFTGNSFEICNLLLDDMLPIMSLASSLCVSIISDVVFRYVFLSIKIGCNHIHVVVVVDPTPPTCCQQCPVPESCGSQQSLPPGGKERLHFVGIRPEVQARKGGW